MYGADGIEAGLFVLQDDEAAGSNSQQVDVPGSIVLTTVEYRLVFRP